MEKLTQKWTINAFFDDLKDGYAFHRSDYPLHITIAGVFAIDLRGNDIAKILVDLLAGQKSFFVTAGDDALWGEYKDLRVVIIDKSTEMSGILMSIYETLIKNGAVFNQPEYEGPGHILHSTVQKSGRLVKGQKVKINKISLVDMFPDNDGLRRRIVQTINFKE